MTGSICMPFLAVIYDMLCPGLKLYFLLSNAVYFNFIKHLITCLASRITAWGRLEGQESKGNTVK